MDVLHNNFLVNYITPRKAIVDPEEAASVCGSHMQLTCELACVKKLAILLDSHGPTVNGTLFIKYITGHISPLNRFVIYRGKFSPTESSNIV